MRLSVRPALLPARPLRRPLSPRGSPGAAAAGAPSGGAAVLFAELWLRLSEAPQPAEGQPGAAPQRGTARETQIEPGWELSAGDSFLLVNVDLKSVYGCTLQCRVKLLLRRCAGGCGARQCPWEAVCGCEESPTPRACRGNPNTFTTHLKV